MTYSLTNAETERLWNGERSRKLPSEVARG